MVITIRECRRCLKVLNDFSGPNCSNGHAMTCCGGDMFHAVTCENIKLSAGYKAGQAMAERIEKTILGLE